jgi:hypothetical protein
MLAGKSRLGRARSVIVASIALAFGLADVGQSIAGCGAYCEARQTRTLCHDAANAQSLKAREREAEFEKCKADPTGYLQLEELADDLGMHLE